jgi:mitochondrial fission protein ELM1
MPDMQHPDQRHAWLLTDGNAGNLRQAAALSQALGLAASAPPLLPRAPWRWLAPRCLPGARQAFGPRFARLLSSGDLPDLAIGCGRQGALATRLARQRGVPAVQILDPRLAPDHWDLVIAPEHDGLQGDNVIPLLGSLNPVDDAWLADGAARFPALLELPRPRVLVLVGGPTAQAPWTLGQLALHLDRLQQTVHAWGGSLLASTSRRTPAEAARALDKAASGLPSLVWSGHGGENPYPGLLAAADRILCTPDSVNMLSEACATRVPVQVLTPGLAQGRVGRFVQALQERHRIGAWDGDEMGDTHSPPPLRETARVAALVRQRLGLPLLGARAPA